MEERKKSIDIYIYIYICIHICVYIHIHICTYLYEIFLFLVFLVSSNCFGLYSYYHEFRPPIFPFDHSFILVKIIFSPPKVCIFKNDLLIQRMFLKLVLFSFHFIFSLSFFLLFFFQIFIFY